MSFLVDTIAASGALDEAAVQVTYTPRNGTAVGEVLGVKNGANVRDLMLVGPLTIDSTVVVWTLWSATLGVVPQGQDVITEVSGTKWTVQQATEISIGATSIKWRCICVKQRA